MRNWLRGRIRLGRLTVSWGLGSAGSGPNVLIIACPRLQSAPIDDTRLSTAPIENLVLESAPIEDTRLSTTIAC
jgi:hypothetical protein